MSENAKETEVQSIQNEKEIVSSKPKKKKHNSKRRRCKKKTVIPVEEDCNSSKMDDLLNFLCTTISKNESETSVDINPPVKVSKESPITVRTGSNQNLNQNFKFDSTNLPSTSAADLSNLFENLQVHTSKNPIKSNNVTEFLNIGLLKKSKCKALSVRELERLQFEKAKRCNNIDKLDKQEKTDISNDRLKEYFNLDLIRQCPERSVISQIDSSSVRLVSEIQQTFHSSIPKREESLLKKKCLTEYFNVDVLMTHENNVMESIKSTSKLLVNELEQKLLKDEHPENCKPIQKGKCKSMKKASNESSCEVNTFDRCQKIYFNSWFCGEVKSKKSQPSSPPKLNSSREKQQSSSANTDRKFPEYLSPEELHTFMQHKGLFSGIIRINQKNYRDAYITAPDKGMDILIEGVRDRNRALEGDEVYFILKPKEHFRPSADSTDLQRTATVVGIKNYNHNRRAIGTLNIIKNKNDNFTVFSPRDSRLPRIKVKRKNWPKGFSENPEAFKNKLYSAKITKWEDLRMAEGEILEEIGIVGKIETETYALLLKFELNTTPYSDALTKSLPCATFRISETDIKGREDLRNDCIFTIDPSTAVDLDDAVSLKVLPNGNYEIGVHISDVTYFLKEGTPLDKAVSKRATTVYLVQEAYHMLPYELCQLCSLTSGKDRLTFSVLWEVTLDFRILSHRFTRSIINSCAKFSYEQVQSIINNPASSKHCFPEIHGGHSIERIKEIILFLYKLSQHLRNKRFMGGALKIDQPKITFTLNENVEPVSFKVEVQNESHQLIEELMLLANVTVAERLDFCFSDIAFLRSHAPPTDYALTKIQRNVEKFGIILDISSSGSLYTSLLKYSGDDLVSAARMMVLNNIIAKPMNRAVYYCSGSCSQDEEKRHYALNVPLYTHFTSPIRRYADIMVHRLLAASLNYQKPPKWTMEYVQQVANNCNKQKYSAKLAGEASTELFLFIYVGLKGSLICDAVICDVKDKSFDCIALSTGSHLRVYYQDIMGQTLHEKVDGISRLVIKWPKDLKYKKETVQILEMFSIVKVEMKQGNNLRIDALLQRCE